MNGYNEHLEEQKIKALQAIGRNLALIAFGLFLISGVLLGS